MGEPYLCPNREAFSFSAAEGGATPIGTRPVEGVAFRNGGSKDLVVTGVTRAGDGAFRLSVAFGAGGGTQGACAPRTCTPADVDAARDAFLADGGVPDGGLFYGGACGAGRACVTTATGAQCLAEPCECSCGIVKGNQRFFVQVEFLPTAARSYSGSFVVVSNARNTPNKAVDFSGCGRPDDGGPSPCWDGGLP